MERIWLCDGVYNYTCKARLVSKVAFFKERYMRLRINGGALQGKHQSDIICTEMVFTIILVKQGKQSRVLLGDSIYNRASMRVAERTLGGAHLAL